MLIFEFLQEISPLVDDIIEGRNKTNVVEANETLKDSGSKRQEAGD